MLISDEPPSGMENLAEVVVPGDVAEKLSNSPSTCVS